MSYRTGAPGEYGSISGSYQDAIVKQQRADAANPAMHDANRAGGHYNKKGQWIPSSGGGGGGGGQSPTLVNAGYRQQDYDPWSKYRAKAGDKLWAKEQAGDPSDVYKNRLEQMMTGSGGGGFATSDPSYQFRFEQGQKATERQLSASGMNGSGNALAALSDYGQNSASQEFQAQFGRLVQGMGAVSQQYDTQQQRLMKMAGIDNDPTAAAKLNLQAEGINTDRISAANNYNLGMTQAANSRYATDVAASTAKSTRGGGTSIDTESLYAGNAARAVYSANWWDGQENQEGMSLA